MHSVLIVGRIYFYILIQQAFHDLCKTLNQLMIILFNFTAARPRGCWGKLLADILKKQMFKYSCLPHLIPCSWSSFTGTGRPRESGTTLLVVAWTSNPEITGLGGVAVGEEMQGQRLWWDGSWEEGG